MDNGARNLLKGKLEKFWRTVEMTRLPINRRSGFLEEKQEEILFMVAFDDIGSVAGGHANASLAASRKALQRLAGPATR